MNLKTSASRLLGSECYFYSTRRLHANAFADSYTFSELKKYTDIDSMRCYYRPQRRWAKVIFSQACVKNSVHGGGGCLPQCMLGYTTTTREQTPPQSRHPPRADIPLGADPPAADTPQSRHPQTRHPPRPGTHPPGADTPPGPGTPHPPGSRLQHTVNERPVRILLECILVNTYNSIGSPEQ